MTISSESFQKELRETNEVLNKTVNDEISLNSNWGKILIKDCTLKYLSFEKNQDMTMIGNFHVSIKLENCEIEELSLNDFAFFKFEIIDCKIKKLSLAKTIGSEVNACNFKSSNSIYEKIEIIRVELKSSVYFLKGSVNDVIFQHTNFNQVVNFDKKIKVESLIIENCKFDSILRLLSCEISWLHITITDFSERVILSEKSDFKNILFSSLYFKRKCTIVYNNNIKSLSISDCRFDSNFHLCPSKKIIKDEKTYLKLNLSDSIYGNLIIEEIKIDHLDIQGNNFGSILFRNIETFYIIVDNFFNNNKLLFLNITTKEVNSFFVVKESILNNTEFLNIDFNMFKEFVIVKSNLSQVLLSNSYFPKNIQIETKDDLLGYVLSEEEKKNKNMYFRETYRYLKIAMKNQENRKQYLYYKSKEMYYLKKETEWGWDKILLYLNYFSNDHRNSWTRGVVFTLTVALLFFFLYNETLGQAYFYWTISDFNINKGFLAGLKGFMKFITSFPKLSIEGINGSWKTDIVVLLSRIFIGYGIYQTIAAFRKYGVK